MLFRKSAQDGEQRLGEVVIEDEDDGGEAVSRSSSGETAFMARMLRARSLAHAAGELGSPAEVEDGNS